jgi:hypothetical protein
LVVARVVTGATRAPGWAVVVGVWASGGAAKGVLARQSRVQSTEASAVRATLVSQSATLLRSLGTCRKKQGTRMALRRRATSYIEVYNSFTEGRARRLQKFIIN